MDLSIVIVNWNGKHLLEETLKKLSSNLDTWIVDNGSQDDSVAWLKKTHPKINIIENKANLGFGRANNIALRKITSKYVLMLNTDAYLIKNNLSEIIAWLDEQPKVALIGARLYHGNGKIQNSVSPKVDLYTECLNKKLINYFRKSNSKFFKHPQKVFSVVGAAMIARNDALKKVNYFDEDYFFFFEETDLCKRLQDSGWEVWHYPDFKVKHLQGQSVSQKKIQSRIEYHLSRELYFYKHFGREQAKILHKWQERRLWLTDFFYSLGHFLSFKLWKSKRQNIVKTLKKWYALGCPEDQGIRPLTSQPNA